MTRSIGISRRKATVKHIMSPETPQQQQQQQQHRQQEQNNKNKNNFEIR